MDSVKDILFIVVVKAVGLYHAPFVNITSAVQEKLVCDIVTTVLYEEIEEEIANG